MLNKLSSCAYLSLSTALFCLSWRLQIQGEEILTFSPARVSGGERRKKGRVRNLIFRQMRNSAMKLYGAQILHLWRCHYSRWRRMVWNVIRREWRGKRLFPRASFYSFGCIQYFYSNFSNSRYRNGRMSKLVYPLKRHFCSSNGTTICLPKLNIMLFSVALMLYYFTGIEVLISLLRKNVASVLRCCSLY